ncbi:MAG: hypothetical protein IT353_09910 [Gemmatimonadaceae bacterium]|nr:hypothetical protein [Gemmatimonadaceae bacterium]
MRPRSLARALVHRSPVRAWVFVVASAIALLLLLPLTADGQTTRARQAPAKPTPAKTAPAKVAPAPATVAPAPAATPTRLITDLTYGERPAIGSLNPYGGPVNDGPTDRFLSLLYEPLYRWNFLNDTAEPVLALSAKSTTPARGAKSAFIVDLKPNVRWHDGKPFTGADVEFTYRYILAKGQNRAMKASVSELLADVKAIGPLQVRFDFRQAVPDAALVLTQLIIPSSRFAMPTMDAVDANRTLTYYPVGTGPYKQLGDPKKNLELVANTTYHDTPSKIQTIRARQFSDASSMVESFLSTGGDVNMVVEVPDEQLKRVEASRPRVKNARLETYKVHAVALRQNAGSILQSARVRRAIAMAINREQIRDNWFVGRGAILPGPFTPGSPYWDASLDPLPFDTAKARAELKAAGAAGKPLRLIYKTADLESKSLESDLARTIQQALTAVGLNVTATAKTPNQFQESLFNEKGTDWDLAVVRLEFNPVYDVSSYFHSRNVKQGGYNFLKFANPQVDRLLNQVAESEDAPRKLALTQQLGRILRDSVPAVFLVNEETVFAYTSDVIIPDGATDSFYFFTYANQWYFRPRSGR